MSETDGRAENAHANIERLKRQAISLAGKNDRLSESLASARAQIVRLSDEVRALTSPPGSYATFIRAYPQDRTLDVWYSGRMMHVQAMPALPVGALKPGQLVLLNEQQVAVRSAGYAEVGSLASVVRVLDDTRVVIATHQDDERVVTIAGSLHDEVLRPGDQLIVDLRTELALQRIETPEIAELLLEETPDTSFADVGGLDTQIEALRDAIELPFQHPELYYEHGLRPPRGVLLYGPPGTGKTMLARAVAASLASRGTSGTSGTSGAAEHKDGPSSYFLSVRGPQLLDKYVGETERQIRQIFSRARERAESGRPVVIFFDEMEALFRVRGSGLSSDVETTIVPQLLAEIDGVEKLGNVIVIGASNREDMIDPAVLRPGRLDIKIRIDRPDKEAAGDIARRYLTADLPLHREELERYHGDRDATIAALINVLTDHLYARTAQTAYLRVTYSDGGQEILHVSDVASGAMIAAIVDRAKKAAIKDLLAGGERGLHRRHLLAAITAEITENENLAGVSSPEEWMRVTGRTHRRVEAIEPVQHS